MTSTTPSMEEEGIVNEVEEVTKIEIQDLPVEVLDNMVGFLDYSTRRSCRLVSHFLKESVDSVGISVKIDDRNSESITFCKEVNATEVQIEQMRMLDSTLNLNTKKWRTVILSGPIDSGWLNNALLRNCPNLRVLFLDGICLTSRDFGDPLLDPPIFDHLTQIHFYSHLYFGYRRPNVELGDMEFNFRMDRNMVYLLSSLRSRVLRVLSVFVSRRLIFPHVALNQACWEYKALFAFIESHRNSLEEVNSATQIFSLVPYNLQPPVCQVPTQLKQFSWDFVQPFWKYVLLAQVSLERLYLKTAECRRAAAYPLLETVFLNNARTLTVINLYLSSDLSVNWMDMSIFSHLEFLQKLAVDAAFVDYAPIAINLNQLPRKRLTSLVLIGFLVNDFDGVEFMDGFKPEVLTLMFLSTSGIFANRHYMWNFVKLLLRIRSLNHLRLDFCPPRIPVKNGWWRGIDFLLGQSDFRLWLENLSPSPSRDSMNQYRNLVHIYINHFLHQEQAILYFLGRTDLEFKSDYLGLASKVWNRVGYQKQPLNLPRNRESYTILKDPHNVVRVLPDPLPYLHTMGVNDIEECVTVSLGFTHLG